LLSVSKKEFIRVTFGYHITGQEESLLVLVKKYYCVDEIGWTCSNEYNISVEETEGKTLLGRPVQK
jgi:hypothetical protein